MRFPIASSIESRDGSLSKDAKLVNCFVDVEGETSFVVKRPGLRKSVASAAGAGLGMVSWEGNIYHATGLTFYQTSYASIPSGSSSGPTVSADQVGVGSPFSSLGINALAYGGGFLWYVIADGSGYSETHRSSDQGNTWTRVNCFSGAPTQPGRVIYFSGALYCITGDGEVFRTTNNGSSWANLGTHAEVNGSGKIVTNGTKLVYLKLNGSGASFGAYTSTDGVSWTYVGAVNTTVGAFPFLSDFVFHSGKYYVIDLYEKVVSESSDLITWTHHTISSNSVLKYPILLSSDGVLVSCNTQIAPTEFRAIDTDSWSLSSVLDTYTAGPFWSVSLAYTTYDGLGSFIAGATNGGDNDSFVKVTASPGSSFATPPYSYAFTTATPGLPLSWVGTSPGAYTKKMFIKNTEKAWTLTLGTPGTLTQVTDADYPAATVPGAVYLDGYFFVMDKDGTVYNCDLENPDSWNALNYITAEAEWDKGVAIAKHQNYVVALKDWTCELFYDAANATGSPLSKVSNATIQIGCAQGYSAAQFHGGLIFMSKTRERGRSVHFFPSNSIEPQEIASPAIQRILNAADLTTVRAWGGKLDGRILYVLNLVTADISLVYDFTSQTWAQWTSDNAGTEGYFKYGFYATDGNRDYLLHETSGEVFTFTPDVYQDNGADIKVLIRSGRFDAGNMDRKTMSALTVVGDQASTSLNVQYSDDDYQTFSAARSVSMNDSPARLLRLGMFRRRSFDIRHVDNTPLRLMAIDAEVKQAR